MSDNFTLVKNYYDNGLWNEERLQFAVFQGWITEAEFTQITENEYEEPSTAPLKSKDVLFIDYDGTEVCAYSTNDFLKLTSMPPNPTHQGLTAQGWNWTLEEAKEYVREHGILVIGQQYITSDGETKFEIKVEEEHLEYPFILEYLYFIEDTTIEIDWGDGSPHLQLNTYQNLVTYQNQLTNLQSLLSIYEEAYNEDTGDLDTNIVDLYIEQIYKNNSFIQLTYGFYSYEDYISPFYGEGVTYEEVIQDASKLEALKTDIYSFIPSIPSYIQEASDLVQSYIANKEADEENINSYKIEVQKSENKLEKIQSMMIYYDMISEYLDNSGSVIDFNQIKNTLFEYEEEIFKSNWYMEYIKGYNSYEDYLLDGNTPYEELTLEEKEILLENIAEFVIELIYNYSSAFQQLDRNISSFKSVLYSNSNHNIESLYQIYNPGTSFGVHHYYSQKGLYTISIKILKGSLICKRNTIIENGYNDLENFLKNIYIGENFILDDWQTRERGEDFNYKDITYSDFVCIDSPFSAMGSQSILESCTIPNHISFLPRDCFYWAANLTGLVLPKNLKIIPPYFCYQSLLKNISLSNNIEKIQEEAFNDCRNIQTITFPNSLKIDSESSNCLASCFKLKNVSLNKNIDTEKNIEFFEHLQSAIDRSPFLQFNLK